ncbi:MAG: hypothetical protein JNN04_00635 [Cyclobacteriaceae bacterium]|nr:hypothetical protein [Cyclobacteriaceae bacterium]
MNRYGRFFLVTSLLAGPDTIAQLPLENSKPDKPWETQPTSTKIISIGYNTFGEFYVGGELPKNSNNKLSMQAGYQVAITSGMSYQWGPFGMTTPWLNNNCKGIRIRIGYQTIDNRDRNHLAVYLEAHQLESNPFINQDFSGSSQVAVIYFTETYQKYGVRFLNAKPLNSNHTVFFTMSVAVFYSLAHRTYLSASNGIPLPPEEDYTFTSPQITFGLQFLLF